MLYLHVQNEQLDIAWPITWEKDKVGIREYLKKIWKDKVPTHPVADTLKNRRNEAKNILTVSRGSTFVAYTYTLHQVYQGKDLSISFVLSSGGGRIGASRRLH